MADADKPNLGGRPEYVPSKATRRQVAIAAGAGMSHEQIALGLGICRNTLEKHFEYELSQGACAKLLKVHEAVYAQAIKGNITAAREYTKAGGPRQALPPAPTPDAAADAPLGPIGPEGLKGARDRLAKTAELGTEWDDVLRRPKSTPLQ